MTVGATALAVVGGLATVGLTAMAPAQAATGPALMPAVGQYVSVPVYKVLDTRSGIGETTSGALAAGATVNIAVTGADGVPATAESVVANISAMDPTGTGYLSDFSSSTISTAPTVGIRSGVNTDQDENIAIGADGEIDITNNTTGTIQIAVVVEGYFTGPGTTAAGATYGSTSWNRVVSTATGADGVPIQEIPGHGSLTFQVTGEGGIPVGATTAVLQLNAMNATATGDLSVYPTGSTDPDLSDDTYSPGLPIYQNLDYVPLSSSGQATVTNEGSAPVNFAGIARGYFLPPATTPAAASYGAMDPAVVYGTAGTGTALAGGASVTFQVAGTAGIPTGVSEVTQDIVALNPTASGSLDVYPGGTTDPIMSAMQFLAGDGTDVTFDNTVVSSVSPSGQETITNHSSGTLNIEVIARGYFAAPVAPQAPASVTATISGQSATVDWAAPASDGGSPITSYTVSASPDSATATENAGTYQATLTGLTNAATDSFTVTTTNALGNSVATTYTQVSPIVVENTVSGGTPVAAGATVSFAVGGQDGLPKYGVGEASLNVQVENETQSGSVALSADESTVTSGSLSFTAPSSASASMFVPGGSDGEVSLTNTSTGTVNVIVTLNGWSAASAVLPGSQQASFLSSTEALGTPSDVANLAIYDLPLMEALPAGVESDGSSSPEGTVTSTGSVAVTTAASGSDTGYVTSPGVAVAYSSADFDSVPISSCPSGSKETDASNYYSGYDDYLITHVKVWTLQFHESWCYNKSAKTVPSIEFIRVLPNFTQAGGLDGWEYTGLVSGTSETEYYTFDGAAKGGVHAYRDGQMKECPVSVGHYSVGCMNTTDVGDNMNVHYDGTHNFYVGADQG